MASRRSRQRQNARPWSAGEVIEYDEHDPTPWPLPDRHAGDFGPPDDSDSEGGETDVHEGQQA